MGEDMTLRRPGSKRKVRSDKKHRYKRNRVGNLVPYVSKRKRTDPIKIWWFKILPMSTDGFRNWARNLRPYVMKTVFPPVGHPISVDPSFLATPEALEQLAVQTIGFEGNFQLRMPSASRSSWRVSYKKKAVVKIVDSEQGLKAFASEYGNLSRYWFFKKQ